MLAFRRLNVLVIIFRLEKSLTSPSNLLLTDPTSQMNIANMANVDDILIVTAKQSELGILWVNYLKACFDKITKQRGRIPFK